MIMNTRMMVKELILMPLNYPKSLRFGPRTTKSSKTQQRLYSNQMTLILITTKPRKRHFLMSRSEMRLRRKKRKCHAPFRV